MSSKATARQGEVTPSTNSEVTEAATSNMVDRPEAENQSATNNRNEDADDNAIIHLDDDEDEQPKVVASVARGAGHISNSRLGWRRETPAFGEEKNFLILAYNEDSRWRFPAKAHEEALDKRMREFQNFLAHLQYIIEGDSGYCQQAIGDIGELHTEIPLRLANFCNLAGLPDGNMKLEYTKESMNIYAVAAVQQQKVFE